MQEEVRLRLSRVQALPDETDGLREGLADIRRKITIAAYCRFGVVDAEGTDPLDAGGAGF